MPVIEMVFWFFIFLVVYCYAGYGAFLFVFNSIKQKLNSQKKESIITDWPSVTFIIPVFDEEDIIEQKIENTLSLNYPANKLNVIFITDGSRDGSVDVIKNYPDTLLLHMPERRGKSAAIKRAMRYVKTQFVVFSDANAILNSDALQLLMKHFADSKVGGVAGEKKVMNKKLFAAGMAEGIYWRYESFLKKQDAAFYSVVGAAGELFAIRTHLFKSFDDSIILDDFMISVQVCLQGYRFAYEPGAYAIETPSVSLGDEKLRKVRIAAGAYQTISQLPGCFNMFKYPLLCFQYFSRRLLRWTVCPLLFVLIFFINVYLLRINASAVYFYLMLGQIVFYIAAFFGWLTVKINRNPGWLTIPFYFVFMNMCLYRGFFNFISNKHTVLWKKSLREAFQ
jgi:Glycosyltransferases, probably involved in cell wall biogenesis